jgi:hypothetical protein
MSVLVVSEECDPTSDAVVQALQQRNTEVHRVDLSWFPMRLDLDAALGTEGWVGTLRTRDREIALEELSSVFYRSPTAFQFAPGLSDKAYELRLTVVGSGGDFRFFPVAIHAGSPASKVDFRADYESLTYSIADIPGEVASGVQEFMRTFGISLAHFDFCVDDSGCHWFLECNGSGGQYQFAEKATGLPITDAIADLLRKGIS